ncbi:MAG: hypothetical protein ACRCTL_10960 [Pseudomonas sp.]
MAVLAMVAGRRKNAAGEDLDGFTQLAVERQKCRTILADKQLKTMAEASEKLISY